MKKSPKSPAQIPSKIRVGKKAPAFTLFNESGASIALTSYLGKSPIVLYFYPKDMTSGCTQESCDFRDAFPRFKSQGAVIFGISRDSVQSHLKFKDTYKLPFSLLADTEGKVCAAYGVWKEKSMYGRKYMGIERTTVVIGKDGRVKHVFEKVKIPGHIAAVEAVVRGEIPAAEKAAPAKAKRTIQRSKAKPVAKSASEKPGSKNSPATRRTTA